jgi:ribosomal protein S18 acetylase RimI-like enzyme
VAELAIRKATRDDLAAVLELYAEPEMDDGQVLDISKAEKLFERLQSYPNYSIYVAEVGAEAVGTFALLIMDNLVHMGAPSGIVESVVVKSKWRRQGIGKKMMALVLERCAKAGCYKVMLSTNLKRQSAHTFYESLGFQKHGYSFLVSLTESFPTAIPPEDLHESAR